MLADQRPPQCEKHRAERNSAEPTFGDELSMRTTSGVADGSGAGSAPKASLAVSSTMAAERAQPRNAPIKNPPRTKPMRVTVPAAAAGDEKIGVLEGRCGAIEVTRRLRRRFLARAVCGRAKPGVSALC